MVARTGSTGYIGGDGLHEVVQNHPEYEVTCLVRNSEKGAQVASQYGKIKLVYGDLDSEELLQEEAKKADIVLRELNSSGKLFPASFINGICFPLDFANSDHEAGARALLKGLASHPHDRLGYLIHTSGTGVLLSDSLESKKLGEAATKSYNDWEGVKEVTSLPDSAPHRNVDKIVLAAGSDPGLPIRTAIVCPPTIYGKGRGPGSQRGAQLYMLANSMMEKKKGFQVGEGQNSWTSIHVHDLSKCYLKLVEAAARGGGNATWGEEGYYFTENGNFKWGEAAQKIASEIHKQGFLDSDEVAKLSNEEIKKIHPWGLFLWGSNSIGKAVRARKLLNWSPQERDLYEEIPSIVTSEAVGLGLVKGHAAHVNA